MATFTFAPASKDQAKARLALAGPSGSGKTFTALTTAVALGSKPVVIDTEYGSASKYADLFTFDTAKLYTYDPRTLIDALGQAGAAGYDVVVVDSLSHFWMGAEGMLEQVDNAGRRSYGGNNFGGWKEMRPVERGMVDAMLGYPGHVIVTMRTKSEWVIEDNAKGKKVPKKIGTKPEQRDGIEFEFDVVGDMDLEHTLVVSKSRCPSLAGQIIRRPDQGLAEELLAWLTDGKPVEDALAYRDRAINPKSTYAELTELYKTVNKAGLINAAVVDDTGETVALGILIASRGSEAKLVEARTAKEWKAKDDELGDGEA